jgi:hypothetical protein
LHRADVLAGALVLLDADGLEGLTMRKLAAHLGVQAELPVGGDWKARASGSLEHDGSDFARAMTATIAADPAERFAYGLELLIDGIRSQLPK